MYTATPDAASVFFVVRYTRHSMAWCAIPQGLRCRLSGLLTHHAAHNGTICGCCVRLRPAIDVQNRISRRPIMVTLAGQPQGWPVSVYAGISTPVNVTAPIERGNSSGDSVNMYAEAVTMVNASPCPCPLFVWRFFSCQQSTYHTVTATSEHEARAQLPDAPCLFAARIRTEGVRHA
ncbi:host cell division inhibitor Icd-like protein [Salmonella enterica]|nr:ash family protein [Salmonella enterica]EEM9539584.1 host cell division inhibitor Icd-like protein [Salmonella enterica]EEN0873831.1 host cell division inhibitor Icd-like protein [Salmonella enterica]EEN1611469.1 host cell division inhibitor Icd-like protein [Salmonella enterica]